MNGLADYPAIVNVWVDHMTKTLADEPLSTPEEDEDYSQAKRLVTVA